MTSINDIRSIHSPCLETPLQGIVWKGKINVSSITVTSINVCMYFYSYSMLFTSHSSTPFSISVKSISAPWGSVWWSSVVKEPQNKHHAFPQPIQTWLVYIYKYIYIHVDKLKIENKTNYLTHPYTHFSGNFIDIIGSYNCDVGNWAPCKCSISSDLLPWA